MTAARTQPDQRELDGIRRIVDAISQAFATKIVGQHHLRESLLIGLLADGHILLESVPGLAKTTAAKV
ncbi:MAG: AAA family ATPase, partial [Mycobacterium sp.]